MAEEDFSYSGSVIVPFPACDDKYLLLPPPKGLISEQGMIVENLVL